MDAPYCVAASPTFGIVSPWTLTVSTWSVGFVEPTVVTAVFDSKRDPLLARPITVDYVVSDGTTCAPNCATPWTSEPWPVTPTSTESHIPHDYTTGWILLGVVAPTVGGILGLAFLVGLVFICMKGVGHEDKVKHLRMEAILNRHRQRQEAARQEAASSAAA